MLALCSSPQRLKLAGGASGMGLVRGPRAGAEGPGLSRPSAMGAGTRSPSAVMMEDPPSPAQVTRLKGLHQERGSWLTPFPLQGPWGTPRSITHRRRCCAWWRRRGTFPSWVRSQASPGALVAAVVGVAALCEDRGWPEGASWAGRGPLGGSGPKGASHVVVTPQLPRYSQLPRRMLPRAPTLQAGTPGWAASAHQSVSSTGQRASPTPQ